MQVRLLGGYNREHAKEFFAAEETKKAMKKNEKEANSEEFEKTLTIWQSIQQGTVTTKQIAKFLKTCRTNPDLVEDVGEGLPILVACLESFLLKVQSEDPAERDNWLQTVILYVNLLDSPEVHKVFQQSDRITDILFEPNFTHFAKQKHANELL